MNIGLIIGGRGSWESLGVWTRQKSVGYAVGVKRREVAMEARRGPGTCAKGRELKRQHAKEGLERRRGSV